MAKRERTFVDDDDRPRLGRKISAEEFIDNYICHLYDEEDAKRKAKLRQEAAIRAAQHPETIYNPITLFYQKIVRESMKARLFEFEDGTEHWFSKRLSRVDKKRKHVTIPMKFTEETSLLDFKIAGESDGT